MVDLSIAMTNFAIDIMRVGNSDLVHHNVHFRRHLTSSLQTKYDLVIAHRVLCEIGSKESRLELVASLWRRTKRFLILIDSGLYDAFEALMDARDFLLLSGTQLHLEDTISLLEKHNLMTDEIWAILHDKSISDFERYAIISEQVPDEVTLPTALPSAKIYAPCPHDLGCPKLTTNSQCVFPVRWRVIRADGRRSTREISGTETGNFTFVILEKCLRRPEETLARILRGGIGVVDEFALLKAFNIFSCIP
ncbi:hypothetical protein DICVIV_08687 [Dictyocaulus viviparus]|uniref:Uncharacterized protein n=1 Tax=Dictyocaulus viviparus TaxID=29172 RepID=A0A0D8XSC8_DICVI|nr:hypothetical protein DICVIV_08687 [Dictyocaulus viviparus]